MSNNQYTRRQFMRLSLAAAATLSPLSALARQPRSAGKAPGGSFKALVVVLLEGGADVFNMIAPTQADKYADYRATRENIALPLNTLLPFSHANQNGLNPESYGMRSNMSAMHSLFEQGKLAIVANTGTLVQPVTRTDVENGAPVPFELFAHNTQRSQWMLGDATGSQHQGWAARIGNQLYAEGNPWFNVNVSDSNNLLQTGGFAEAIHFDDAYISPNTMNTYGFGPESGGGELGKVYQNIYKQQQESPNRLMATFARRRMNELLRPNRLEGLFDNVLQFDGFGDGVHETGKPLGRQLELVANILSVRQEFETRFQTERQIFFVNQHGWDTHDSDNEHQVGYLSESLAAFQNALAEMGIEDQVTTLTLSDFGRSLTSNNAGTDHGWGTHAFVMGGAVNGGDIYGRMPEMRNDSPDAWSDRMIPTTAMESYLASATRWLGLSDAELGSLFPNLASFPDGDPGFMS
ncbi:DUF1501 domain-containing protein [Thiolapillus brandeum]|uniref:DUF1501 domain-containing protein n=1 Tax=Thiolapillus brandeum TaxID=1076588 RepID=A0A7U6GKX0_9GAMM|nr:DUF1501 domain-containing protein [Thiolapillus brandeum]BAO45404.1 conserved hypothetical protein [Thiolapillus brandeum]